MKCFDCVTLGANAADTGWTNGKRSDGVLVKGELRAPPNQLMGDAVPPYRQPISDPAQVKHMSYKIFIVV